MAKISWKGGALLSPMPAVLVTSGSMEKPGIMTVSWTGMVSTNPPKTYISVRPERASYPFIKESGEFVINLTPASLVRQCDFCGVRSGNDVDKFEATGLTPVESVNVSAPSLLESPVSIECKVSDIIPLGSHDMFLADIISVSVEESLIDKNGRLALEKADLMAYVHGEYYTIGKKIGSFGFSVKKKTGRKK